MLLVLLPLVADIAAAQRIKTTKQAGWNQTCLEDTRGKVLHCRLVRRVQLTSGTTQGQQVIFQVRRSNTEDPFIRIQVPASVDLQSGVSVAVMDGTSSLSTLAYRSSLDNCRESGCFAKFPLDEELLAALKTNKIVRIGFADAAEERISVAVSLRNFERAYEAMGGALK